MNVKSIAVALVLVALTVSLLWASVVLGNGDGEATDREGQSGSNVSDSPAYENERCVPGLVGDGTGCLDGDQAPPVNVTAG